MPIRFDYDAATNIVTSVATGEITPADSEASHRAVLDYRRRYPGMGLLVDMREAEVAATPAGVIAIIDAFFELVGVTVPVAFINRLDASDTNAMIAETRAFIAGAAMRSFYDETAARSWLGERVHTPD